MIVSRSFKHVEQEKAASDCERRVVGYAGISSDLKAPLCPFIYSGVKPESHLFKPLWACLG